jgi:zinc D-Ala-D-Ala carboxypeptidase
MSYSGTARADRVVRSRLLAVIVLAALVAVALGVQPWLGSPTATSFAGHPLDGLLDGSDAPLHQADGVVPEGTTVFDDVPAVTNLDPVLRTAVRRAARAAARDGVGFELDSGWRSVEYQRQLLDEAIAKYGSEHEAARWVASPETSAHVSGDAVDIGGSGATRWLAEHGAAYGLCQIYANEPWHYELRAGAADHGCPRRYADAAHDPRMQAGGTG